MSKKLLVWIPIIIILAITASYIQRGTIIKKKVYELRFGYNMPSGSVMDEAVHLYVDAVQKASNGRVHITTFPNQQLGNDHEMIEMAIDGDLDILLSPTSKMGILLPQMQYLDIPFIFPQIEDAYAMIDSKPGKLLLEGLKDIDLVGAAFWGNGFKQFTSKREIRSPKDFNGRNVRIMKSNVIFDQFSAFDANPIPIDFHETYKALKDGKVEAQENPISVIFNMKLYEVQPYLTISNHAYLAYVFCFSKKVFDKLPPDIQKILISKAIELTPIERELIKKHEETALKKLSDYGMKIIHLDKAGKRAFHDATAHMLDKYGSVIGSEIIEATKIYLYKKYKFKETDDIVIGLNADMSMGSALAGIAIKRGMEIAVDEINENGGLLGKKLHIEVMDHCGLNSKSEENIKSLYLMKNLVAIMGGLHSSAILSNLETIHKDKIIYLVPWAANTTITDNKFRPNYVYRISVHDDDLCPFILRQALKVSDKIAFMFANNQYGRQNEVLFKKEIAEHNIKPSAIEWYNLGEENMSMQLKRIKLSGAKVLILQTYSPEGTTIIKNMVAMNLRIPVISNWSIAGGNFWQDTKNELKTIDLTFPQTFSFMNTNRKAADYFVKRYLDKYGLKSRDEIIAPSGTAQAYDLVKMLALAIKRTGRLDREAIRDKLEEIDRYDGLIETYSYPFTMNRHDALDAKRYFMSRFNDKGVIIPIEEYR